MLPGILMQMAPSLSSSEAQQLTGDMISQLSWSDILAARSAIPNIQNTPMPDSLSDLSPAELQLLKKFLSKLPARDQVAVAKILKMCPTQ